MAAFCRKFELIPVQREWPCSAAPDGTRGAVTRREGREILIFPEGTRKIPGSPPDYKPGIAFLYHDLKLPVCPLALNSGAFWPRHSFLRYPGTIVAEFLDPIPPGLPRQEFMQRLEQAIETASDRLLAEAKQELKGMGFDGPDTREAADAVLTN